MTARPLGQAAGLDPLSPFTAVLPVMVVAAVAPTHTAPLMTLLAGLVLLVVADLRRGPGLACVCLGAAALVATVFALSAPVERVGTSPVLLGLGPVQVQVLQALSGLRLGAKLGTVLSLCLLTGLLSRPDDLLRALTTHLRVPYRVAYTGVAALGMRRRLVSEYQVVKEAHALRGTRAPLPLLRPLVRAWTVAPALTAGAVRHAERVAASMDARGFGAYPTRTERTVPVWRWRDTAVVALGWLAAAALATTLGATGLTIHDV